MVSAMFGTNKNYKRPACFDPIPVLHEITSGLWLGSLKAAEDLQLLKTVGITHMVSLGAFPLTVNPAVKQHKVEVHDIPSASIYPHLPAVVDFIH